jgi:hypothetical protein
MRKQINKENCRNGPNSDCTESTMRREEHKTVDEEFYLLLYTRESQ